jgi:hypothetical protein
MGDTLSNDMAEAWESREDNSFNVVQVSRREAKLPICRTMWVDGEEVLLPALRWRCGQILWIWAARMVLC